ncbi:hypothetical protein GMORB2_2048 [Geosmithia morbida]|uniref:Uncharacterized protein n=1 Tax=Geosmithia morbida TaxID=1094350 RepID=A0A9P5D3C1_9HYPO|nr:uncharacterized protein GMORB2_2048 [Geosmithia morbida]KAF4121640.1 hypothetical protein GMORB2_2048 [Geosmithia morbida]
MSSYYGYNPHVTPHTHHGGRNRRAPRLTMTQNTQRQFRGVRSMKELNDSASLHAFRNKFEAGRSFELEDDLEFCPGLLTETDVSYPATPTSSSPPLTHGQIVSISSASERSSLASNSPQSSPTQQPQSVAPTFSLNTSSPPFIPPSSYQAQQASLKLHQPAATRGRNAIPIVNPTTGISMSSPPSSVSPAKMQQSMGRLW